MSSRPFATPGDLVDALSALQTAAGDYLDTLFEAPTRKVVQAQAARYSVAFSEDVLVIHALRWIALYLTAQGRLKWKDYGSGESDWGRFVLVVMIGLWKHFASQPEGEAEVLELAQQLAVAGEGSDDRATAAEFDDGFTRYDVRCFARPLGSVSGDAVGLIWNGRTLSVLVADGCGKSWPARLLVQGVYELWKAQAAQEPCDPPQILARIRHAAAQYLPEGLFVEAALARFQDNDVEVSSAGGARFLLGQGPGGAVMLREFSGYLLGDLGYPQVREWQQRWDFFPGFELVMASDGLYDQKLGGSTLLRQSVRMLRDWAHVPTLHTVVVGLVENAIRTAQQNDDVTIITVRRLPVAREKSRQSPPEPSEAAARPDEAEEVDEATLVDRYLQGSREAGNQLASRLLPLVRGVVRRVFGPQRQSEWDDAVQTICFHILQKVSTWRRECPFGGWAAVVAGRRAIDLRARRSYLPLEFDLAHNHTPLDAALAVELGRQLQQAVENFPPEWRKVLQWEIDGVNHQEMADRLGKSRRTVQYWLEHIRTALLKCLEK